MHFDFSEVALATEALMLEVKKNPNEPISSLLRRFKNKVRQANILTMAKSKRHKQREISRALKKKSALKKIEAARKKEYARRWGKK